MKRGKFIGFGFSGYRSIGDSMVKIDPLKKINFIIGKNNSGKSNIINYLYQYYNIFLERVKVGKSKTFHLRNDVKINYHELDRFIGSNNSNVSIAFPASYTEIENYISTIIPQQLDGHSHNVAKRSLLKLFEYFKDSSNLYWFEYISDINVNSFNLKYENEEIINILNQEEWHSLWSYLTRQSGGDIISNWIPEVISIISYKPDTHPGIELIPAIRKIGEAGSISEDYSGSGIIDRLARLENPSLNERKNLIKFNNINKFLQTVLDNETAKITIPYDRDTIIVEIDNRTLPLSSLGTGIHEVIILASAATILDNKIICIEEPELHLHPLLQKKLVKYLETNTSNNYIFTTHSAHLLDAAEAEIFHVTQIEGTTKVESVYSSKSRSHICNDLGYKSSDILQANCVIWVEGPSDRIYLNNWIHEFNPNLVEGIHYSIMFYGGRLFSHLTALDENDKQVNDFISVRKLNRNSVIMFDSDSSSPRTPLNDTKRRLKSEFDEGPGFAWVTKGREVENYLEPEKLRECIKQIHPSAILNSDFGKYTNLLNYRTKKKEVVTANKVAVARKYVDTYPTNFNILDLKPQLIKLIKFIENCN